MGPGSIHEFTDDILDFHELTNERKNGKFNDSKNGILSIYEPQLTNM